MIKDTKFFDGLVGYFYASGFHAIYKSLESTGKVRILIGISTNPQTYDLMQKSTLSEQSALQFSSAETKEKLGEIVEKEMEDAEDREKPKMAFILLLIGSSPASWKFERTHQKRFTPRFIL